MINLSGFIPKKIRDYRNYSFPRTFGVLSGADLDHEVDYDAKLTNRSQNADGFPFGCTGYTTTDIATDHDNMVYLPEFTYRKTCEMENHPMDRGCYVFNSLKSGAKDGLLAEGETMDVEALDSLRGKAFEIEPTNGLDWFDALRSGLLMHPKRSISVGTVWPREFNQIANDGIISNVFILRSGDAWHNWKISGIVKKNGVWYLKGKSWQGPQFGDNGFHYMNREVINALFNVRGSEAWNQARATSDEIKTVQLPILEKILSLVLRMLQLIKTPTPAPITPNQPPMPTPVIVPKPEPKTMFDRLCQAITEYEGGPGDKNHRNNNPGNFRFQNRGYRSLYGLVTYDGDYFAVFKTWDLGMLYMRNSIIKEIEKHPTWTILDYIALDHAPAKDGNDPVAYAKYIAKQLGVTVDHPMKLIIGDTKYV